MSMISIPAGAELRAYLDSERRYHSDDATKFIIGLAFAESSTTTESVVFCRSQACSLAPLMKKPSRVQDAVKLLKGAIVFRG